MDNEIEAPINEELNRLAAIAQNEDKKEVEQVNPDTGEIETEQEREITDRENALALATGTIKTISKAVSMIWGIEYDEKTQKEGVDVLAPCIERGAAPPWLVDFAGRYGCYIGLVSFVAVTGYATYTLIQKNKEEQESDDVQNATQPEPQPAESTHTGFRTDGQW